MALTTSPRDARSDLHNRRRGERAERVANWYFRLNGFLSIPGFVVHPDVIRRYPLTEADLIAVRFPHSAEEIADRAMTDDERVTALSTGDQILIILVEVKTDLCRVNGPWSDEQAGNMQRVIRRLGFAEESEISYIAKTMYRELRWESDRFVLQYVAVGARQNPGLRQRYPKLVQLTWVEIAEFLFARFSLFPEKLPQPPHQIHSQWPDFGKDYGRYFRKIETRRESREAVFRYINEGSCNPKRCR